MESLVTKSHFVVVLQGNRRCPFIFLNFSCLKNIKTTNHWQISLLDPARQTFSLFCLRKQSSVASVFIVGPQFPKRAFKISIKF